MITIISNTDIQVIFAGEQIDVNSSKGINVIMSDNSYVIKSSIGVISFNTFDRINILDTIIIRVIGVDYHFIVTAKSISEEGFVSKTFSMDLESKSVRMSAPFADPINTEWVDANESDICIELAAANGIILDWQLPFDQTYPKYSANGKTPLDVILEIVDRTKSMLISLPTGELEVLPRYRVNLWDMANTDCDGTISHQQNVYKRQNQSQAKDIKNGVYIGSNAQQSPSISVESEVFADCQTGEIRIYPSPFRSLSIEHASHAGVHIAAPTVKTRTIEHTNVLSVVNEQLGQSFLTPSITPFVSFEDGAASVNYPIDTFTFSNWVHSDLGAVTYEHGYSTLKASSQGNTYGYSLANLTYTTKYLSFIVTCTNKESVMFIIGEDHEQESDSTEGLIAIIREGTNGEPKMIVTDEYLIQMSAIHARGKNELNEACGFEIQQIECNYNPLIACGDYWLIDDLLTGTIYPARVKSVEVNINLPFIGMKLEVQTYNK